MRTKIFRGLAGSLGILTIWSLLFADLHVMPMRFRVAMYPAAALFLIFAIFGPTAADSFLSLFVHMPQKGKPASKHDVPEQDKQPDER
jgi:hypothetical protein